MSKLYTSERSVQIIISLLKEHKIKKIVASPGTMNVTFIGSVQNDDYFEIYSSIDERSAAYIACGLAAASGEPVVLTCTGATASRNYMSGITEAYYRKLPILALTATPPIERIGNNIPQVIDRTTQINDTYKKSYFINKISSSEDEKYCIDRVNDALLELRRNGGAPININYVSTASKDFNTKELPKIKKISRIYAENEFPSIGDKKIGIFIGAHRPMSKKLIEEIEKFCKNYNAVVLCDQTSNYNGKYAVSAAIIQQQDYYVSSLDNFDILIDIGDVSGAYIYFNSKHVWRVNEDGEIRSRGKNINYVFEMSEITFFTKYNKLETSKENVSFSDLWCKEEIEIRNSIPELPYSNVWIAQQIYNKLPENTNLYLGILNTLRSWNFCPLLKKQTVYCNTGGFGIDGTLSSMLGVALASNKLTFGICGDLAFFYDMNALGNRYVNSNMRIMVINNGTGTEFRNYSHMASQFGEMTNMYIAAGGHYGNKSSTLIKNYVEALGFKYITASTKEEFNKNIDMFLSNEKYDYPIVFEVFTNSDDESNAIKMMRTIKTSFPEKVKKQITSNMSDSTKNKLKKVIGR